MILAGRVKFNRYLIVGIFLIFGLLFRATPAFAEDINSTAVDTANTSDQTSNVGPAPESSTPADNTPETSTSPEAVLTETTPQPDSNNSETSQSDSDAPSPPQCSSPSTDVVQPTSTPSDSNSSDNNTHNTINNGICASATSGDAEVSHNGNAGNATSGDAESMATLLNLLNSSTGLSGNELATFIQNIYGDVTGDIYIDPGLLSLLQSAVCGCNAEVNSSTDSTIHNDIYLGANSGNADVSHNNNAGNATTGNATAMLNLVNVINSIISSGQTFIGTINIFGNLNGDILLPQELLNNLLNPGGSLDDQSSEGGNQTNNTNQTINNDIQLGASSGNAEVSHNGTGGNATTGNASTNLTVLNLTGRQVVAKDALLVFVNVLGKWMGLIVNAPEGATTAALGSNVDSSESCSSCANSGAHTTNSDSTINNNIVLEANSGDATVSHNGTGGNATTGNANSSLNLVNIMNSNFSLSGWFGILFINVFGSWNGSFGIDTAAGNQPTGTPTGNSTENNSVASSIKAKVFSFASNSRNSTSGTNDQEVTQDDTSTLGSTSSSSGGAGGSLAHSTFNPLIAIAGGSILLLLLGVLGLRKLSQKKLTKVVGTVVYPQI